MQKVFLNSIENAEAAIRSMKEEESLDFLCTLAEWIEMCFAEEGKLLIAGNGGSLCDAMHFAEELTGFFRDKRRPLPAIALSDPSHMSCVSNDVGFEHVFARQVEALGRKEDLLIVLSTSGNSENLVKAAESARKKEIRVVGFLGKDGGKLKNLCDLYWIVEGFDHSDRIQEAHMAAIHMIIEVVEKNMFYDRPEAKVASKISR